LIKAQSHKKAQKAQERNEQCKKELKSLGPSAFFAAPLISNQNIIGHKKAQTAQEDLDASPAKTV
jgi:hypothetical protein